MGKTKAQEIRIREIDRCLKRGKCSNSELMNRCNEVLENEGREPISSRQTIVNDIDYMRFNYNAPIITIGNGKNTCYTYSDRNFSIYNQELSEEEIVKATVETVSENTTDGVISPLIYAALGGPVLLWAFKAASTLDSMVGYLEEKYRDIGWSSAKLDDVLNYVPARITALLMCAAAYLTGLDGKNALRIVRRDHANHLSPNCAWSEAAAAGALHIRLGGTHTYFGKTVVKPTIGDADRPAVPEDITKANRLLYATGFLAVAVIALAGLIIG